MFTFHISKSVFKYILGILVLFEPDGASGVKCVGCSGRQLSCAREMSLVVSPMSCSLSPADSWCDVHEIASHPITPAFGEMFSIVFGEGAVL